MLDTKKEVLKKIFGLDIEKLPVNVKCEIAKSTWPEVIE